MNPKKSFDMYHIWLAPRHILNVPTLIVTWTTVAMAVVQYALAHHQRKIGYRRHVHAPVKRKKHVHSSASFYSVCISSFHASLRQRSIFVVVVHGGAQSVRKYNLFKKSKSGLITLVIIIPKNRRTCINYKKIAWNPRRQNKEAILCINMLKVLQKTTML